MHDPKKVVVARCPCGQSGSREMFGMELRDDNRQIGAALKAIGFDRVFDTSFTAIYCCEESNEFIKRVGRREYTTVHIMLPCLGEVCRTILP